VLNKEISGNRRKIEEIMPRSKDDAFSLVELSIVLIIIGLLAAGVSGGSKLIHNAKLRTVITDVEEYKTAFQTFFLTYDEYPVDMTDSAANDILAYVFS